MILGFFYCGIVSYLGATMKKDLEDFVAHLQILTAKLYRLSGENLLKRLHIIEVYAEMCDIMIEFNIEQFEDSEDSEEQESEEK
tara:strand:+ start:522 stop:773 length:252 start_codon:yes stop_codon:yes gene_type:complete